MNITNVKEANVMNEKNTYKEYCLRNTYKEYCF